MSHYAHFDGSSRLRREPINGSSRTRSFRHRRLEPGLKKEAAPKLRHMAQLVHRSGLVNVFSGLFGWSLQAVLPAQKIHAGSGIESID